MSFDVAVVGAGHNGLAAALRLARAGRSVVVLEGRARPGGLCAPRAFHPGFTAPGVLHDTTCVRPALVDALGLARHGLSFRDVELPVFAPASDGRGLLLHRDPELAQSEVGALAPRDAESYRRWRGFLQRVRGFLTSVLDAPPPPLDPGSLRGLWALAKRGIALRRLGRDDMTELMRVAPMSVADWLEESFRSPSLCGLLAAPALLGTFTGPRSPGSATQLLLRECTAGRPLAGGPLALIEALLRATREEGVQLRTEAPVRSIRLQGGRVAGLRLASGDDVDAPIVAASCDPLTTFFRLLRPGDLPRGVEEQIRVLRVRGTTAKVHLALNGPLEFAGREGATIEAARIGGGTLDDLERAFDAVKYRRFSERPYLDVMVPTIERPDLAPPGHHVVSILVSFAPHGLEGGWSEARREALGDVVVGCLAEAAPGVDSRVVAREVLTPVDLAADYGLSGGNIHHGEHALDQLLCMRPAPCCAHYGTPIPGLYLCGSGSHPGGGITGVPGALGAAAILAGR